MVDYNKRLFYLVVPSLLFALAILFIFKNVDEVLGLMLILFYFPLFSVTIISLIDHRDSTVSELRSELYKRS